MIKNILKNRISLLVVLCVLSFIVLPTSYSRYIEQEYGQTQSSLAKWNISVVPDTDSEMNLLAHNDTSETYLFQITSISEVASDYSISLLNVPSGISVIVDNNGTSLRADANNKIIINNLGGFDLNGQGTTKEHTLEFVTDENTTVVDDGDDDTSVSTFEVDLVVLVKQRINESVGA